MQHDNEACDSPYRGVETSRQAWIDRRKFVENCRNVWEGTEYCFDRVVVKGGCREVMPSGCSGSVGEAREVV